MTETNPKVYVVQNQLKTCLRTGDKIPKFNFEPAYVFGDIEFILSPYHKPFDSETCVDAMHLKLRNYTEDDFLLLVGNPCLIGAAVAIAAEYSGGIVKMLQWSNIEKRYICIEFKFFD